MTVNRTKTYAEAAKMSAKKTFPDSQSMLNDPNIMIADTGATCDSTASDEGMVNMRDAKTEDTITAA